MYYKIHCMAKDFLGKPEILCGTPAANYFAVHDQDVTCRRCKNSMGIIHKIPKNKIISCIECGEKHIHKTCCSKFTQD